MLNIKQLFTEKEGNILRENGNKKFYKNKYFEEGYPPKYCMNKNFDLIKFLNLVNEEKEEKENFNHQINNNIEKSNVPSGGCAFEIEDDIERFKILSQIGSDIYF